MKWEYKVLNINCHFNTGDGAAYKIQEKLDKMGEDGWELVSCQCYDMSTKFMLVLKRIKKNTNPPRVVDISNFKVPFAPTSKLREAKFSGFSNFQKMV